MLFDGFCVLSLAAKRCWDIADIPVAIAFLVVNQSTFNNLHEGDGRCCLWEETHRVPFVCKP